MRLLQPARPALTLAAVATLALTLTACGQDDSGSDAAASGDAAAASGATADSTAGPGRTIPGASGMVAAIDGTTLQVQSAMSGQVAVTYTDTTTFTAQVAGTLGDVTAGSCVVVVPAEESTSGTDALPSAVTAASVQIVAADDGCASGAGGGPGGAGGGERPEGMPSGGPTDMPSDRPSRGSGSGSFVRATSGSVTAVSDGGFTVETAAPGEDTATSVEVTVTDTTTYSTRVASDASALAKGVCVTATGEADDTGAVTAAEIGISDPVDGECTVGFTMRGGAA